MDKKLPAAESSTASAPARLPTNSTNQNGGKMSPVTRQMEDIAAKKRGARKVSTGLAQPGAYCVKPEGPQSSASAPSAHNNLYDQKQRLTDVANEKIRAHRRSPNRAHHGSRSPTRGAAAHRSRSPNRVRGSRSPTRRVRGTRSRSPKGRAPSDGDESRSPPPALKSAPPALKSPPPGSSPVGRKSPPPGSMPTAGRKSPPPESSPQRAARPGAVSHMTPPPIYMKEDPNFPTEDTQPPPAEEPPRERKIIVGSKIPKSKLEKVEAASNQNTTAPTLAHVTQEDKVEDEDYLYNNRKESLAISSGRASLPGVEQRVSFDYASSKEMEKSSMEQNVKMSKSPSGTGMLPTLEAVRVDSQREREIAASAAGVVVATAEKDSCWSFLKRNRWARWGAILGCLAIVGLAVALGLVFSGEEEEAAPPEIFFFDQLGPNLDGVTRSNQFGSSMALNQDGTRLVVADLEDVFIYELEETEESADWILVTVIETPENATLGINGGESDLIRTTVVVDISNDGSSVAVGWPYSAGPGERLATGRVEVYQESGRGDNWEKVGNTIYGSQSNDYLGVAIALGEDGDVVAAGAPGNDGNAVVYALGSQGAWAPMGSPIEIKGTMSVASVAFKSGTFAFAGQPLTLDGVTPPAARIFRFADGDWIEKGGGIFGDFPSTAYLIQMSADGNIVAVSNFYTEVWEGELNDALDVRVFEWDGTDWARLGDNLHALAPGEKSGYFITLADDGKLMGMGDPGRRSEDGGGVAGHVHIYRFKEDEATWKQVGPNRDGDAPGDQFGCSLALSGDGQHFAAGAPFNRGDGIEFGRVYVFDLANIDEIATQEGWGGGR